MSYNKVTLVDFVSLLLALLLSAFLDRHKERHFTRKQDVDSMSSSTF